MSFRNKLLAAAVFAGAACALLSGSAAAYDGKWYVAAGGGWEHMDDGWANSHFSIDDGYIIDARFGTQPAGSNFRWEGDLSYRNNSVGGDANGHINIWSFMGNMLYDFKNQTAFTPYVGVGAGLADASYKVVGTGFNYSDSSARLAGQAIAGITWDMSPQVALDFQYRYMALDNASFKGVSSGAPVKLQESFGNHAVLASLVWKFGAPPPPPPPPAPPPPPPPPPAAPTVFKIFFPWDVATLTTEAKNTVDEIASQYKDKQLSRIDIQGNTDTSGSSDYNMGLGTKRAAAVRAELVAQGIPDSVISTESLGETNPAVKTGDNVREPLNRRAEVYITLSGGPSS